MANKRKGQGNIKNWKSCMNIMHKRTVAEKGGYHQTRVKGNPTPITPTGVNENGEPKKSYFIVNLEMIDPILQQTRLRDVIGYNMSKLKQEYAEANDGHILDPKDEQDVEIIEGLRDQLPFNDILNACQVSTIVFSDSEYIPANGDKVKVSFSNNTGTYQKEIGDGNKREYTFIEVEDIAPLEATVGRKANMDFSAEALFEDWDASTGVVVKETKEEEIDGHDDNGIEQEEDIENENQ